MIKLEIKKIFSKKINRILLSLIIILSLLFSYFAITSVIYVNDIGKENTGVLETRKLTDLKNKNKGYLTNEKLAEIVSIKQDISTKYTNNLPNDIYAKVSQPIRDIVEMINQIVRADGEYDPSAILKLNDYDKNNLYELRDKNIEKFINKTDTLQKQSFLREKYREVSIPFYYEGIDSINTIIRYLSTVIIILVLFVAFISSQIFVDEFYLKSDSIFFSTRFGKSKAKISKIFSGILITTIVYILGTGVLIVVCSTIMGTCGIKVPHQFEYPYSIYNITLGQELLLVLFCGYVACILACAISMYFSIKFKNNLIAITIVFFMFIASPFVGRVLPFKIFFQLTCDQLLNISNCIRIPYIYQFGNIVFRQVPFLVVFYLAISILMMPLIYFNYRLSD